MNIRAAKNADQNAITALLHANKLPYEDISAHINNFILAEESNALIGCVGLEIYDEHCLLRSFAVTDVFQGKGIGSKLYQSAVGFARENNINTIHILTTTAELYFKKLGYQYADRADCPPQILSTLEFSTLCPSTAKYMRKEFISDAAL